MSDIDDDDPIDPADIGQRAKLRRPRKARLRLKQPGCWKPVADFYDNWFAAPGDPDVVKGKRRTRAKMTVGRGVNFVRITQRLNDRVPPEHQITWQELTRYNWKTETPAEINWYLWLYFGPRLKRTHDHQNYSFDEIVGGLGDVYDGSDVHPHGFLWVPVYNPLPTRKIPAERRKTIVIDELCCPYRKGGMCEIVRPGGKSLECDDNVPAKNRSPAGEAPQSAVSLDGTPAGQVAVELQRVKVVRLTASRMRIWRIIGREGRLLRVASANEIITRVFIDYMEGRKGDRGRVEPGGRFSSPAPMGSVNPHQNHPLDPTTGLSDLAAVAKTVRDLYALGRLERLIIRGYEDGASNLGVEAAREHTKERADWVHHALATDYALPLVAEDADETIKRLRGSSSVPVLAVGCGTGDARLGVRDDRYRVALVEYETRDPVPLPNAEVQEVTLWEQYERLGGPIATDMEQKRKLSAVYSRPSKKIAIDTATLAAFRDQIWPYLVLMLETAKQHESALRGVRNHVLSWTSDTAAELNDMFAPDEGGAGIEKLTARSYRGYRPQGPNPNLVVQPAQEWDPDDDNHGKPWLRPGLDRAPNHLREELEMFSCEVGGEELSRVLLLVGKSMPLPYRIAFA